MFQAIFEKKNTLYKYREINGNFMGKFDLGMNLAKDVSAYVRTSGRSLLQTKPTSNISIEGLRYQGNLSADICSFKSDRTLCPQFLDNLAADLEAFGSDTYKKIEFIKNRMLYGMGYKSSPELLKIKKSNSLGQLSARFSAHEQIIEYSSQFESLSNKELIGLIRHELDHLDKYAKTISCEGFDAVQTAYAKTLKLDKDFWATFSNEARTVGFDSKKYLEAIRTYRNPDGYNCKNAFQRLFAQHLYCINPLEESAYKLEKQINNHFGIKKLVHPDCYGEPVKRLYDIMVSERLSAEEFEIAYAIRLACRTPEGLVAFKNNDLETIRRIANQNQNLKPEEFVKILDDIYKWFEARKIDINTISSN